MFWNHSGLNAGSYPDSDSSKKYFQMSSCSSYTISYLLYLRSKRDAKSMRIHAEPNSIGTGTGMWFGFKFCIRSPKGKNPNKNKKDDKNIHGVIRRNIMQCLEYRKTVKLFKFRSSKLKKTESSSTGTAVQYGYGIPGYDMRYWAVEDLRLLTSMDPKH